MAATPTSPSEGLHALTWAWWLVVCLVVLQLSPNPATVVVVMAIAYTMVTVAATDTPLRRAAPLLVAVAAVFAALRVVLVALTSHPGGDALVVVPSVTLPTLLGGFEVGGAIETEVVARVAAESLLVVGIIAVVAAFNAVVSHAQLVRSSPRAFHELGLVVTVALAFVPSLLAAVRDTREADVARAGGRPRRRGRLRRLLVPVVDGALDRATRLAASMDARGFGHGGVTLADRAGAAVAVTALVALLGSLAAAVRGASAVAAALVVAGVVGLAAGTVVASRGSPRTRYRRSRPARDDVLVMAAVTLAPVLVSVVGWQGGTVGYAPAVTLVPGLEPLVGVGLLALAAPALVVAGGAPARRPPAATPPIDGDGPSPAR